MSIPNDYVERVYAGVLGKIIGVYLGRPFEGWEYKRILEHLGEINYYVHEKLGKPLIVTDDDISGTFTFLRALEDHGNTLDLSAEQIGQTWLNYLIEERTILWWGGIGNSTEHTAYLRLKHGIPAPDSGSIAVNGKIVAEQIGAQIFVDGWAMVSPGDPLRAAALAQKAGSVSHDGEALYGAMCLAAMEAQAFVESDIDVLLDTGLSVIPADSTIARMIGDIRRWVIEDEDWEATFRRIEEHYGYKDYIGNCHMVPNHALIILGLLYGQGDFQRSLMVCNTSGWDTDCNSGNLACLLGIRSGLAAFEGAADWRGPVADRIYLPTMDGGRCVTDAVAEALRIVNMGRALNGLAPLAPKNGARFHFELPGSVQGFQVDREEPCAAEVELSNAEGHSRAGSRALAVRYACGAGGAAARISTATFIMPGDLEMAGGYSLIASPTLYPGQTVRAALSADAANSAAVVARLLVRYYDAHDQPERLIGPSVALAPGEYKEWSWTLPELQGMPVYAVGVDVVAADGGALGAGTVYLDYLTWDGRAKTVFTRPEGAKMTYPGGSQMWRTAWVDAVDQWHKWWRDPFRLIQNEGRGMVTTGMREWRDYTVTAALRPAMVKTGGLAVRVQGLRRFYALQFTADKRAQLLRVCEDDGTILAEIPFDWQLWGTYTVKVEVQGERIRAWVDGLLAADVVDEGAPLQEGALGIMVEEGQMMADWVQVE